MKYSDGTALAPNRQSKTCTYTDRCGLLAEHVRSFALKQECIQLLAYNENPLFLQLATSAIGLGKDLPFRIYEALTEIVSNTPTTHYIPVLYKIETGEAERIAVDQAAKPSDSGAGGENPCSCLLFCGYIIR